MSADPAAPFAGSLRERRRITAMYRIQTVALDLFERRGFDEVTVEEVAAAAEVSPSSVYRYFGTKEHILLWDEFDPGLAEMMRAAVRGQLPFDGVRDVVRVVLANLTPDDEQRMIRRMSLVMAHPSLEAAVAGHTYTAAELIGDTMADELGRDRMDLGIQVFSHTLVGGLLGALHHWHGTGFAESLADVMERCFEILEEGLDAVSGAGGRSVGPDSEAGPAPHGGLTVT